MSADTAPAGLPPARSRRVPAAHGLTLHLREWPGPDPPLLFLHGFLLDSHAWDFVVPRFAGRRRVLALDCRGHGDSDRDPQYRYHHVAFGMDVRAVLDHLGIAAVELVAHSTCGHAAIGFAARYPERVRHLVLVDAGPELAPAGRGGARGTDDPDVPVYDSPAAYADELARRHPRARREVLAHLARCGLRARAGGGFEPKADPAFTKPRGPGDAENRRAFDRRAWAAEGERMLWADLARLRCPLLALRGACSAALTPGVVARMLEVAGAQARAVELPGAGHNPMLDAPEELAGAIDAFLASPQRGL